jgi:type I pantothenate kinase
LASRSSVSGSVRGDGPTEGASVGLPAGDRFADARPRSDSAAPHLDSEVLARFRRFDRAEWSLLRDDTPLVVGEADLDALRALNDRVSVQDVVEVYLPLARLLLLHLEAQRALARATDTFLRRPTARVPFVVGIAGSVAVGKSTTARLLQAMLSRSPAALRVDLVTTDGFLLPNAELERRGLLRRKGFPESYDRRRLLLFLAELKAGAERARAPVYSHEAYDIVPGAWQVVERPDVLIIEGLNVLQPPGQDRPSGSDLVVSDFFDFSIYVDADETSIEEWYVERFLTLRSRVFRHPTSYFHRYADLDDATAVATAREIWADINAPNLKENILPTRERAHLVLAKDPDHTVREIRLRKL